MIMIGTKKPISLQEWLSTERSPNLKEDFNISIHFESNVRAAVNVKGDEGFRQKSRTSRTQQKNSW